MIKQTGGNPRFQYHVATQIDTPNLVVEGSGVCVTGTGHTIVVRGKVLEFRRRGRTTTTTTTVVVLSIRRCRVVRGECRKDPSIRMDFLRIVVVVMRIMRIGNNECGGRSGLDRSRDTATTTKGDDDDE